MKQIEVRFPNIDLESRCNADECPMSVSGSMDKHSKVCALGHESTEFQDPNRAIPHTLLDETYRIGTFLPMFSAYKAETFGFMLFKEGQAHATQENQHYDKRVLVRFSESGSVDEKFMLTEFLPYWSALEGPKPRLRMIFMDHHRAHFTDAVLQAFTNARTIVVRIPKSMTTYLQALDVFVFSWFRRTYQSKMDPFASQHAGRKWNAMEKRIYTQQFAAIAYDLIQSKSRYQHCMESLGYINVDKAIITIRGMPLYRYDADWLPSTDVSNATTRYLDSISNVVRAPLVVVPGVVRLVAPPITARGKKKRELEKALPMSGSLLNMGFRKGAAVKREREE